MSIRPCLWPMPRSASPIWSSSRACSSPILHSGPRPPKILGLVDSPEGISRLYAETLTASLVIELTRLRAGDGTTASVERGGLAGWQRRIVCDFMNDNLDRDISLEELAALARLSATHFCRSFTRSMGMPPHQYQVHQRVEHAKHLLADTERSITEVAIATGYSASSNFATVFRRVTGVSPQGVSPELAVSAITVRAGRAAHAWARVPPPSRSLRREALRARPPR